jgi:hypothetical protein
MMKFVCELCGITVYSEKWYQSHLQGKIHAVALAKQEQLNELASSSVFLDNFKVPITQQMIEETLGSIVGHVSRVIMDKKAGKFAIVEFSDKEVVQRLLEQKSIRIGEVGFLMVHNLNVLGKRSSQAASRGFRKVKH